MVINSIIYNPLSNLKNKNLLENNVIFSFIFKYNSKTPL